MPALPARPISSLLLAVDVGNTQTVFGLYADGELGETRRAATEADRTGDELGVLLTGLIDLDTVELAEDEADDRLLAIDEALTLLAAEEPAAAEVVKLRFFAGLTTAQAAAALGVSTSTAENDWAYARSWLRLRMGEPDRDRP